MIAHEFSHILNGDMRLNIRLMGVLFGILMLGLIGRKVLQHGHGGRGRGAGAVLGAALVAMLVGYIGLFFGRMIKAGVSRTRERLADADGVGHDQVALQFLVQGLARAHGAGQFVAQAMAAEQAVASPLLEGVDLSGARGVLVNVTASRGLKGKEVREVMAAVRAFAAPDASIAQGIAYNDEMGDEIRVTVVATGLGKAKKHVQLVPQQQLRTGTHGGPLNVNGALGGGAATNAVGGFGSAGFSGVSADVQKQPAVWRRESATEQVNALAKSGMETYDIPAFLRKQAD